MKKFRNLSTLDKLKVVMFIWVQMSSTAGTFIVALGTFSDRISTLVGLGVSMFTQLLSALVFVRERIFRDKSVINTNNE